jgi:hypothetical protein
MRAKMWLITSGAKREMQNNPKYYDSLKNCFPKCIPSPYEKQINMVYLLFNFRTLIEPSQAILRLTKS